jgi:hypothetical protein
MKTQTEVGSWIAETLGPRPYPSREAPESPGPQRYFSCTSVSAPFPLDAPQGLRGRQHPGESSRAPVRYAVAS